MPKIRLLNRRKPHLIQREKDWWICNLPGAGRWYMTGDGFTKEQAYDNWFTANFDRTSGKYMSRMTYLHSQAAGLMTVHPILRISNDKPYSNVDSAPDGNFFTAHKREP